MPLVGDKAAAAHEGMCWLKNISAAVGKKGCCHESLPPSGFQPTASIHFKEQIANIQLPE
jgi:hypothetical protein